MLNKNQITMEVVSTFLKQKKRANEDLNYLSSSYFFANKDIDQASFQKQNNDIRLRINQKKY